MSANDSLPPPLTPPPPVSPTPRSGSGGSEVSLMRISLPFAMVLTFGGFLVVSGYTVGGIMQGIARDKTEVEARLGAIEREITGIKQILADRTYNNASSPATVARCK